MAAHARIEDEHLHHCVQRLVKSFVFENIGVGVLMLEYASHGNLAEILDGVGATMVSISSNFLRDAALSIAVALDALHHQGIVHLDIKPQSLCWCLVGGVGSFFLAPCGS